MVRIHIARTPEHTALARKILGLGSARARADGAAGDRSGDARQGARTALAPYMALADYANNWRRLGYGDDDFAGGGSDRFVDANVAWGDRRCDRPPHPAALGCGSESCLHPAALSRWRSRQGRHAYSRAACAGQGDIDDLRPLGIDQLSSRPRSTWNGPRRTSRRHVRGELGGPCGNRADDR